MLRYEPHTPWRWGIIVFGNPDLETLSVHVPAVNTSIFGVYGVVDGLGFSNSMFIGTRIVDDCDDQKKRKNVRIPHRPRAYPTNSQTQLSQQHSCLSSFTQPQHLTSDTWWSLASDVVGLFRVAPVGTKRSGTRSLEFLTSIIQSGRCLGKVTEDGDHGRFVAKRLRQANICESL